ncbi:MAG: hypothetical protein AB8B82_04535 [Roseovarius sp.]
MTAFSVWLLWDVLIGQIPWPWQIICVPFGIMGVLCFGNAALIGLMALVFPRVILRVDQEGIHVWRYPALAWDDLTFADAQFSRHNMILVLQSLEPLTYSK